jgi:hypothetical protein
MPGALITLISFYLVGVSGSYIRGLRLEMGSLGERQKLLGTTAIL